MKKNTPAVTKKVNVATDALRRVAVMASAGVIYDDAIFRYGIGTHQMSPSQLMHCKQAC